MLRLYTSQLLTFPYRCLSETALPKVVVEAWYRGRAAGMPSLDLLRLDLQVAATAAVWEKGRTCPR